MGVCVGADFGSTYCNVGVWHQGRAEIIANHHGLRSTPTLVAFTETEVLVGEAALTQQAKNRENTVYGFKWMVDQDHEDLEPHVKKMLEKAPFTVSVDSHGSARVVVHHGGATKTLDPEDLCTLLFEHLKGIAEAFSGQEVDRCVLSVPVAFTAEQRLALQKAGKAAGLPISVVLCDPVATAIAYGLDRTDAELQGSSRSGNESDANGSDDDGDGAQQASKPTRSIIVVDWGGGGMEVTLLKRFNGLLSIEHHQADPLLGGDLFTERLMQFCAKDFKRKIGADVYDSKKALFKLERSCEEAIRSLTMSMQTDVYVEALMEGCDMRVRISRMRFEDLCSDIYEGAKTTIKSVLKAAKESVDMVLLAGGIAQMPKVQSVVKNCFPEGTSFGKGLFPDEAVVIGATIQASLSPASSAGLAPSSQLPKRIPLCPAHIAISTVPPSEEGPALLIKAGSFIPLQEKITLKIKHTQSSSSMPLVLQILQVEATTAPTDDGSQQHQQHDQGEGGVSVSVGEAMKGLRIDDSLAVGDSLVPSVPVVVLGNIVFQNILPAVTNGGAALPPPPSSPAAGKANGAVGVAGSIVEVEVGVTLRSDGILKVEAILCASKEKQELIISSSSPA